MDGSLSTPLEVWTHIWATVGICTIRECRLVCSYWQYNIDKCISLKDVHTFHIGSIEAYKWLSTKGSLHRTSTSGLYNKLYAPDVEVLQIFQFKWRTTPIGYFDTSDVVHKACELDHAITLAGLSDIPYIKSWIAINTSKLIDHACYHSAIHVIKWIDKTFNALHTFNRYQTRHLMQRLLGSKDNIKMWKLMYVRLPHFIEVIKDNNYELFLRTCVRCDVGIARWLHETIKIPKHAVHSRKMQYIYDVCDADDVNMLAWLIGAFEISIDNNKWRALFLQACDEGCSSIAEYIHNDLGAIELSTDECKAMCKTNDCILLWYLESCMSSYDIDLHCNVIMKRLMKREDMFQLIKVIIQHECVKEYLKDHFDMCVIRSCQLQDMSMLKWLCETLDIVVADYVNIDSIIKDIDDSHLHMLKWLANTHNVTLDDRWLIMKPCKKGHLELTQWIHSTFPCEESDLANYIEHTFIRVCIRKHYDVRDWMWETYKCVRDLVIHDHDQFSDEMQEWLYEHYYQ